MKIRNTAVGVGVLSMSLATQALFAAKPVNHLKHLACSANEVALFDGSNWVCSDIAAQQQETIQMLMTELEALKESLSCVSNASSDTDLVLEGCNVHVRNGAGQTASVNGLGNLIIGYGEDVEAPTPKDRTGSHNIVVGPEHTYSSYSGIVSGFQNTISGEYASVSGGIGNIASGEHSSVSGGVANLASGNFSSVSGGGFGIARGNQSSVSGGDRNTASGTASSILGGESQSASFLLQTIPELP